MEFSESLFAARFNITRQEGIGICSKEAQDVPVRVGIPTIRIDRMTVGVRLELKAI